MRELIYTDIVPKKIYIAKSFLASGIDENTFGISIDKFTAEGGFYSLRAAISHPGGHCTDCDLGIGIDLVSPGNDPESPDTGPAAFEYLNYSLSGNYYTFTHRDDDNYDYGQTTGSIEETNDYIIITLSDEFLEAIGDTPLSDVSIGSGVFFTNDKEESEEPTPPTPVEPVIKSNYALIANSIRAKTGKTALMTAAQMPDEIASIPTPAPVIEGRLNLQEGATCSYDGFIFVTDGGSFNNGTYTIHVGRVNISKSACSSKEYELHMKMEDGTEVISLALLFNGTSAGNFVMTSTESSYEDDLSMCSYATIEEVK